MSSFSLRVSFDVSLCPLCCPALTTLTFFYLMMTFYIYYYARVVFYIVSLLYEM